MLGKLFARLNIPSALRIKVVDDVSRLEHLYQCGVHAFSEQRYHEAAQIALRAIALNADLTAVHYLLGCALLEMGKFGEAEQAFSTCLALGPTYPLVQHARLHQALAQVRGNLEHPSPPRSTRKLCPTWAAFPSLFVVSTQTVFPG